MNLDKIFNINILHSYYRESKQNFFTFNHLTTKLGVTPDITHKYKKTSWTSLSPEANLKKEEV
jgi:hypothetical protein